MTKPTLREKTKRGLLWASAEAVARTLLQTLVLVILSRLLSPGDYGVVGAALVVVGVSAIFSQLGVGPAIVQRREIEPRHLDAAFTLSVVFGLFTAGLVCAAAPLFADFFKMDALTPTLRVLAVVFPIASLGVVSESLLHRELRFDLTARAEVVSYFTGGGAVAIALAWSGWGHWALVAGQIVQMLVRTAMLFAFHAWRPRLAFDRAAAHDLRHFSSGITVARLANYLATSGDNVVVGRYLGAGALGVYNRAYQLMSQPAILIGNVLDKVLFPAMAKVQAQDERLSAIYRQGVRLLATAMLPGSAVIYLLAPEIVRTMLGPKWLDVIFPLQIFSGALLFRTSMKFSNSLLRAKGAVWQMAWCQITYAAATVGFAYAGRAWGMEGVCIGVFASILLCFLLCAALCLHHLRLGWIAFLGEHLPGIGLAAVVYAAGWLALGSLHASQARDWMTLLVAGSCMGAAALLILLVRPVAFLGPGGVRIHDQSRKVFSHLTRFAL